MTMEAASPLIALVEMTSSIDPDANLATMDRALAAAATAGAVMAFFPEMSVLLDRDRARSAAMTWLRLTRRLPSSLSNGIDPV